MVLIEGASTTYTCGCSISTDDGYRAIRRDGSDIPALARPAEFSRMLPERNRLLAAKGIALRPTLASMVVVEAPRRQGARQFMLPMLCAIHGGVQKLTHAFTIETDFLPKPDPDLFTRAEEIP